MNMMATDRRELGYKARLQTRYMNTTGMCVELFFQITSTSYETSSVFIITVSENKAEHILVRNNGYEPSQMWNRLYAVLPDGINQVVIEGERGWIGFSSVSIDDVAILPCSTFGKVTLLYSNLMITWWHYTVLSPRHITRHDGPS
jgi:MAM domain, meprin/A5/mu